MNALSLFPGKMACSLLGAFAILCMTIVVGAPARAQMPENLSLRRVSRSQFQVTEGAIEEAPGGLLAVTSSKMRAVVPSRTSPIAEIRFKYLGPSAKASALGSGEMRRQLGLKLRAQDPCNLVYVMWRLEPKSGVVVSLKQNPGQHSSAGCENGGYRNIKPVHASSVPGLEPGSFHSLQAEMKGEYLTVRVDHRTVWEGSLGSEALGLEGPVGVRTDNGRFEFEFFAGDLKP